MADFTVLRGPSDPLPIKYADQGDGTAAEVVSAAVTIGGVTVDPFEPNGNVASLTAGVASSNVALPAGTVVVVTNNGSVTAFLKLSVGAGTAAVTDFALVAGASVGLTVGSNTYLNGITSSSTAALRISGGSGLPVGFGGGSSGGGGSGTSDIIAVNGVTALAGAGATGTGSLRTTAAQDTTTIAGAAPLTTGVYVTGPSAAALATAALQTTTNTNLTNITGTKAAGTAAANSALTGGVYNSTPPTLTNGQQAATQVSAAGRLLVDAAITGGGDASAANQTVVQGVIGAATAPTKMEVAGAVYNSTPLTVTNGQSTALQSDANGYLKVNVATATGVAQGSTTSGQTISPVGAAVTTSSPTYTTGQTSPLSLDTTGALRVNVTAGGAGGGAVEGVAAHDASSTGADPVLVGGYAKAAAPTDVSADGDAVNGWFLRNGAQATVLTAAGALIGGDATNGLDVDITRMAALVAGSALIGNVGHGKTIKSVGFSLTADGDLVALVSSKRIKVIAYYFSKAGTTASIYNIRTNNASGTILAKIQLQAQTGGVYAANLAIAAPSFLFASAAGEALYLDVPDAEAVTGFITYFDDDAT